MAEDMLILTERFLSETIEQRKIKMQELLQRLMKRNEAPNVENHKQPINAKLG